MSIKNDYYKVCALKELKEKTGKRFLVNDIDIAVFKIKDEVFAVSNNCPHQHTQMIYDGLIEDNCVVCPAHGWMFDLKTGCLPQGAKGLRTFPVIITSGDVYVKVDRKELNW
jgi:NAD(P)H-dependent nitrite reductase small subunit